MITAITYKIDFEKFNRRLFPCWFLALRFALLVTSFICIPPFVVFIIGLSSRTVHTTLGWFCWLTWIQVGNLLNSYSGIKIPPPKMIFEKRYFLDIGVFFCDFISCISSTHCQTNRNDNKKITPLITLTNWMMLCVYHTKNFFKCQTMWLFTHSSIISISFMVHSQRRKF